MAEHNSLPVHLVAEMIDSIDALIDELLRIREIAREGTVDGEP